MRSNLNLFARAAVIAGLSCTALTGTSFAQAVGGTLSGSVTDASGAALPNATITFHNEAGNQTHKAVADGQGHFRATGLPAGVYTVETSAAGFAATVRTHVRVQSDQDMTIPVIILAIANTSEQVNVEANSVGSIAAALAPMDALLDATSARTEITGAFIRNFLSPVADYGEAVEMTPGTFTTNSNGVGLGQSKTYFRGFPDGDYDIDFDGIPFYDTNTPTHHSWAFFPAQFLGGIDFDRSPGNASTIGPTPFGGSIHLLSKNMAPLNNVRATFSGGSFNTYLYDLAYDSGAFGPGKKFNMNVDVHHLQSHGYQSLNNQTRNAGALKFQYQVSPDTTLTGFSGVIWLDANTPNFNATRCQMYGVSTGYNCFVSGTTLYPYTGAGINFLLTNNADPNLYLDEQYNSYHVPTDFEYVGVHSSLGKGFVLDIKPYTYNYDNSEKYSNAVPITNQTTINGSKTYNGAAINPCNVQVLKKGVLAYPCSVDKYNSYRKYGETSELSQVSRFGILRAGMWYEWANTNRHQAPTDPLDGYVDSVLPNFSETYVTDSYQPYAEYQFQIGPKLTFTPGVKFAYYTIGTKQYADNGGKIGPLTGNTAGFIANGGSYLATLPSASINYRIKNGWSAYVQAAQGSIVPPSAVFDFTQGPNGTPVGTLPKQQKNTTYQAGTVFKIKRATFDADVYHIHFDNSYSSFTPAATGEPVFYVQPSSTSVGLEGESNIYVTAGVSVYLNASYNSATYKGTLAQSCTGAAATGCAAATPQYIFTAPSGLNVAQTPSDVETEGITYQHKAWNIGLFNKRVGTEYEDVGVYHNQSTIAPFTLTNANVNYTIRSDGRFNNTKLQLSFNNVFNEHSITSISNAGTPVTQTFTANNTSYVNPFITTGQTPINGQDAVSILPARSIMFTVTFGHSMKR